MRALTGQRGFTFIEILVVVTLIAAVAFAMLPQIGGGFALRLDNSAQVLAADLRYAGQRAISTGRTHRWSINLDGDVFRIEEQLRLDDEEFNPSTARTLNLAPPRPEYVYRPVDNKSGSWRAIGEAGVEIGRIVLGSDEYEDGLIFIAFSSDGGSDPAQIEIVDEHGDRKIVRLLPFTGDVRISNPPDRTSY